MASCLRPLTRRTHSLIVFRSAVAAILAALQLGLGATPVWPQAGTPPAGAPSAESLTQNLVGLAGQNAPLQTIRNAATARRQRLLGLMESDPAAVLRVAIPAAVRAGLPAAIQPDVEEEVTLDGELEVFHEDYALDIMGNPSSGHFTAYQKERLGWLNYGSSPPISTVSTEGLYSIDTYETAGTNPKALKILKSTDPTTGRKTWYYVEYRQAVGFDSFLSGNVNVLNGVVIHLGTDSSPNSSYLLDLTPVTASWNDPALVLGQSFSDTNAGVIITPVSMTASSASVQVTMTPQPCVRANPTVTTSPSQSQWVPAGTMVNYSISVTNADSGGCAPSTFALGDTVPAGWTALLGTPSLTLSPDPRSPWHRQVTSPGGTPDGFYQVTQSASNTAAPTYWGSTQSTYVVASSLSVSVSAGQASYNRNQFATLTATVRGGTAPASGASVAFTVTKPGGAVATGTATTNSSGQASYKLRIQKQDPVGTYAVSVKATLGNVTGTATTSFQVN